jgi:hypothetical protein
MPLTISDQNPSSEGQIKPRGLTFWILILFFLNLGLSTNAWAGSCEITDNSEKLLKENLRKNLSNNSATVNSATINSANSANYQALLVKHKDNLTSCRQKDSIKTQVLWLRLNAPNAPEAQGAKSDNAMDGILDRVVNQGYNTVIIEVLGNGQILLPVADNPTPWRSLTAELVKSEEILANYDLWAEVIRKGQERGLRVYGAASSLRRSDTVFVDPYSSQVKSDFAVAIAALVKRQPDGILFDDLNYPPENNLKNPNIYGTASRQALIDSMPDRTTKDLMATYLDVGKVTSEAISTVQQLNNINSSSKNLALTATIAEQILGQLAKNHAQRGILAFLKGAIAAVNTNNSPTSNLAIGAIFAPNDPKSEIYNPQAWEQFPPSIERYPKIYTVCGTGNIGAVNSYTKCVTNAVLKVVNANPQSKVCPVLAMGVSGIPSLEIQTQAITATVPKISCIAHYRLISPDR